MKIGLTHFNNLSHSTLLRVPLHGTCCYPSKAKYIFFLQFSKNWSCQDLCPLTKTDTLSFCMAGMTITLILQWIAYFLIWLSRKLELIKEHHLPIQPSSGVAFTRLTFTLWKQKAIFSCSLASIDHVTLMLALVGIFLGLSSALIERLSKRKTKLWK